MKEEFTPPYIYVGLYDEEKRRERLPLVRARAARIRMIRRNRLVREEYDRALKVQEERDRSALVFLYWALPFLIREGRVVGDMNGGVIILG